ncbi:cryptochrome DASH [Pseudozyma hubeiensis SY62]|uniref:Cryptochrome DASH n=1 Tax=Pseudozyma hubeiensis (strain SY62) TaxID=1305764 RepID=R9PEI4_PSEHS|nr:cryptochrome DASH [Pseudozyma hubeiensis SY62]GAC99773.1 cryptochrome DASH [Pseudozyma hubeiensis SY62]
MDAEDEQEEKIAGMESRHIHGIKVKLWSDRKGSIKLRDCECENHRDGFPRCETKERCVSVPRVSCVLPLGADLAAIVLRFDSDIFVCCSVRTPQDYCISRCPQHRQGSTKRRRD